MVVSALGWVGRGLLLLILAVAGLWAWGMPGVELRGVWQQESGGNFLRLTRFQAEIFHANPAGCTLSMAFPAHLPLLRRAEGAEFRHNANSLTIDLAGTVDNWQFTRVDALPEPCKSTPDTRPRAVFDMMWEAMDAHYAFFDLHGVDWSARRKFAPAADATLTDQELFDRITAAVAGLDDGHIQLIAPGIGSHSPESSPPWLIDYDLDRKDLIDLAAATFGAELKQIGETPVRLGLRPDGIGFLEISGMWLETGFGTIETDAAYALASKIATQLAEAKAIIVDVRYNGGGSDGVALAYASLFSDNEQVVLRKRSRVGDGWSDWSDGILRPHPDGARLTQPVILLTSDVTASAAEIFAIAMRALDQVTVMGEPTGGGLSDILDITLPNGWSFGLSNQEYVTESGQQFEKIGVPPDIEIRQDGAGLADGHDALLEAALERLSDHTRR